MRQFVSERPYYAQPAASAPPGRPVRAFAPHHSSAVKRQHPSECGGGVLAVWGGGGGGRKSRTAAAQTDSDERSESRGACGRERERLRMRRRRESEALDTSQSSRSVLLHLHADLNVCSVFYFKATLQTSTFLILCNPTCACSPRRGSQVSAVLHSAALTTLSRFQ